jgi:hypothetical protein
VKENWKDVSCLIGTASLNKFYIFTARKKMTTYYFNFAPLMLIKFEICGRRRKVFIKVNFVSFKRFFFLQKSFLWLEREREREIAKFERKEVRRRK